MIKVSVFSTQFRIRRYLPLFFSIFISTIFFSSCARLPKPSIKYKTILVVKDEFFNSSSYPVQVKFKFNIKSANGLNGDFWVTPTNGNAIISRLEPGNYTINGYSSRPVATSTGGVRTHNLNLKFELKRNQITLLKKKLIYRQEAYRNGWKSNWSIKNISSTEKREVINLLRKDENFSLWRIYTPSTTTVKKTEKVQKDTCDYSSYNKAIITNSVYSLNKYLRNCTNKTDTYHKLATKKLATLKTKKPVVKKTSDSRKIERTSVAPTVSLTERPETIIIPVFSMGDVSDIRKQILQNTLTDELKTYFRIVPQEKYEAALEQVYKELNYEECTVDTCIMWVQEMLQVENAFSLEVIGEGKDSQLNLKWITLDEKKNETDVCLGCGTFQLNDKVRGFIQKLVGGN